MEFEIWLQKLEEAESPKEKARLLHKAYETLWHDLHDLLRSFRDYRTPVHTSSVEGLSISFMSEYQFLYRYTAETNSNQIVFDDQIIPFAKTERENTLNIRRVFLTTKDHIQTFYGWDFSNFTKNDTFKSNHKLKIFDKNFRDIINKLKELNKLRQLFNDDIKTSPDRYTSQTKEFAKAIDCFHNCFSSEMTLLYKSFHQIIGYELCNDNNLVTDQNGKEYRVIRDVDIADKLFKFQQQLNKYSNGFYENYFQVTHDYLHNKPHNFYSLPFRAIDCLEQLEEISPLYEDYRMFTRSKMQNGSEEIEYDRFNGKIFRKNKKQITEIEETLHRTVFNDEYATEEPQNYTQLETGDAAYFKNKQNETDNQATSQGGEFYSRKILEIPLHHQEDFWNVEIPLEYTSHPIHEIAENTIIEDELYAPDTGWFEQPIQRDHVTPTEFEAISDGQTHYEQSTFYTEQNDFNQHSTYFEGLPQYYTIDDLQQHSSPIPYGYRTFLPHEMPYQNSPTSKAPLRHTPYNAPSLKPTIQGKIVPFDSIKSSFKLRGGGGGGGVPLTGVGGGGSPAAWRYASF